MLAPAPPCASLALPATFLDAASCISAATAGMICRLLDAAVAAAALIRWGGRLQPGGAPRRTSLIPFIGFFSQLVLQVRLFYPACFRPFYSSSSIYKNCRGRSVQLKITKEKFPA
jgi:hypothetical protein